MSFGGFKHTNRADLGIRSNVGGVLFSEDDKIRKATEDELRLSSGLIPSADYIESNRLENVIQETKDELGAAMQAALSPIKADIASLESGKADVHSPTLTGIPKAPTPAAGDSSTQVANTQFVMSALSVLKPVISTPPEDVTVDEFEDAVFHAEASVLSPHMTLNTRFLNEAGDLLANGDTVTIEEPSIADDGMIVRYQATNEFGTVEASASLTVVPEVYPRIAVLPEDFDNWNLPVNIIREGYREYSVSIDIEDVMPVTTQTLYVNSSTGNDSTGDGTSAKPFATIAAAQTASTGVPRLLLTGTNFVLPTLTKSMILEGDGSHFAFDAAYSISTSGLHLGFRNFDVKYQLTIMGQTKVAMDSPTFTASTGTADLLIRGYATAYIFGATGSNLTASDCLSYDDNCQALEWFCEFDNIGSGAADNCSTAHRDARVVSVMCNYTRGYRPVHDVDRARRCIFGGSAKQSKGSKTPDNSFNVGAGFTGHADTDVYIWLYGVDCADDGMTPESLNDLYAAAGGHIYYDKETIFKNSVGPGVVEPFRRQVFTPVADGGLLYFVDGEEVHAFYSSGDFVLHDSKTVQLIAAAGGGGGGIASSGSGRGGGGGAGGLVIKELSLPAGAYSIVIGSGGVKGGNGGSGTNGSNTTAFGETAYGGGGGGGTTAVDGQNGGSGGSGGLTTSSTGTAGTGVSGQGHNAGAGNSNADNAMRHSGGGGGAGGVGQSATTSARGLGGPGVETSIIGAPIILCAGGDGYQATSPFATSTPPGIGGGGHGGRFSTNTGFSGGDGAVFIRIIGGE